MKPMALLSLLPLALVIACSSSESSSAPKPPCNEDPWQCVAGQTCWPKDAVGTFACLNSAAGKAKGDECTNLIGSPTCGDGLACFQAAGDTVGRCVAYCDNAKVGRGCASGETCSTAMLSGSSSKFQICIGASAPKDAGTDTAAPADAGASESGSSVDSGSAASDAAAD